jgi:serine/threonine protein kinase/WD40 repeat protein
MVQWGESRATGFSDATSISDSRSMNASDSSLYLDENLARLLAAYDQGIGEADAKAATVGLEPYVSHPSRSAEPEPPVSNGSSRPLNEGSARDLFPGLSLPQPQHPHHPGVAGPHRIGRFELRRQLGKGGCGIVFLAYDPRLKRDVALKLPRPEMLLSPDARRRLIREAHAAAEFDHPNLVPVYETGEIGPLCFIATAFCPGQTLAEWLDRQAFPGPIRQAARLVAQLADAIQHAHDRGVLHRDMKPNNVILQETKADPNDVGPPPGSCLLCGEHFVPRIVDFGLAKLPERGPSETASRQILGTPKYMAPEQAQARHDDIGPQADVYALGVILYELLTGRAPYEGESDVEVLRRSIEGDLTPPRHLRFDLPRDLEAICLKAMARVPGRRYRTAIDLADDLRRFLDGRPTLARPLNRIGRAARWLRRNDQVVALTVVTTIALFFLSVGLWMAYQSELLRTDRDNIRADQAGRARLDRQHDYARSVHDAFLAWRTGDLRQMHDSLMDARMSAAGNQETPDFTWGYLSQLEKTEPQSLSSPAGVAVSLAVSPGGRHFAAGHRDGSISLWDARTGSLLSTGSGHGSAVRDIVFINGGTGLATAASEPNVRTWMIEPNGRLQPGPEIPTSGAAVETMATSRDGSKLFLSTAAGECSRWRMPERTLERRWNATGGRVVAMAASPTGDVVVTAARAGPVRFWNATDDRPIAEAALGHRVQALAILPATKAWRLAIADDGGRVHLYDQQGRRVSQWQTGEVGAARLSVSPDGTSVARFGPGKSLSIWNPATGSIRDRLFEQEGAVRAAAFGLDGRLLYSSSEGGAIRIRKVPLGIPNQTIRGIAARFTAVAFAGDGNAHTVALPDGSVESYAHWGANPVRVKGTGAGPIELLQYGKQTDPIGIELAGNSAAVWTLGRSPRVVHRVRSASGGAITAAALSKNADTLALGDEQGRVRIWSIGSRQSVGTIETGLAAPVRHLAVSDDGRWLAAPASEQSVGVWEVGKADRVYSLAVQGERLWLVQFLSDNERLVTVGQGSSIRIWSTINGTEELVLLGHIGRVTTVATTPDGRTLASGSSSGEVRFWDLRTGQDLMTLRRHAGAVRFAEFVNSGSVLITGGQTPDGPGELGWWEAAKE